MSRAKRCTRINFLVSLSLDGRAVHKNGRVHPERADISFEQ